MSIEHVVQQGDCLASIAKRYGFRDWKTVYDDDSNLEFRKLRPDPHVLQPGDHVYIPDKKVKAETCETSKVHRFQLRSRRTRLRLMLRDIDDTPLAGKRYQLTVAGEMHEGRLPDNGLLDEPIPADAVDGELIVWSEGDSGTHIDKWTLKLGHLDPMDSLKGVQARLNNLGYDCGPVDGVDGSRTQTALKKFQRDHDLEVDGIPGPQTQATLKNLHTS